MLGTHGKELLNQSDSLRELILRKALPRNECRLATFEVFSTHFLSQLTGSFWSEIEFELQEGNPGKIETMIVDGQSDFGITYIPIPHSELDHIEISKIEMGTFTLKGAFKGVATKDLPFVVPIHPVGGSPNRMEGLDGWLDCSFHRKIVHRVALLESALELVRLGRVAGYFPVFIVDLYNKKFGSKLQLEKRKNHTEKCITPVYLIKRKRTPESKMMRELAKAIRRLK